MCECKVQLHPFRAPKGNHQISEGFHNDHGMARGSRRYFIELIQHSQTDLGSRHSRNSDGSTSAGSGSPLPIVEDAPSLQYPYRSPLDAGHLRILDEDLNAHQFFTRAPNTSRVYREGTTAPFVNGGINSEDTISGGNAYLTNNGVNELIQLSERELEEGCYSQTVVHSPTDVLAATWQSVGNDVSPNWNSAAWHASPIIPFSADPTTARVYFVFEVQTRETVVEAYRELMRGDGLTDTQQQNEYLKEMGLL